MAHPRLVVGGSFLVALVLAGAAAVALRDATDSGDQGSSTAAPLPTPSETAPSPAASDTPTASPSPSPSPVAIVTPKRPVTVTASPSPSAATRYAYPKPSRHYTALYLAEVGYDPDGDTGHPAPYLKAHAVDGDGTIRLGQVSWGDGSVTNGPGAPASCRPAPSPTTRPGPYQPHGDDVTYVKDHTYATPGTYTITVTVDSGNADCRPNGPAPETATARLTVTV